MGIVWLSPAVFTRIEEEGAFKETNRGDEEMIEQVIGFMVGISMVWILTGGADKYLGIGDKEEAGEANVSPKSD